MDELYQENRDSLKRLDSQDFRNFGLEQIAYIRPVKKEDGILYAICGADGQIVTMLPDRETALAAIFYNDMDCVTLH